jgi:hypothetical protein
MFDDNILNIDIASGLLRINNNIISLQEPVDCGKLFCHCQDLADTKYIPLCDGINGIIGDLIVDDNYIQNNSEMPIDIMLNYNNALEGDKEDIVLESQTDLQET